MICIENRFCVIPQITGLSLLVDGVSSCVTDEHIYGAVMTPLSINEALALGRALVEAAEAAQVVQKSPFRASIDKALAAARAQEAEKKTMPNPPWEGA
jgi:hypothetical protein